MKPDTKPESLAEKTSKAAAWMSLQTVVTKVLSLTTQLVLARLLLREDFGLYGLAMTVYTFAAMLHQAGLQEVLIKRQRRFRIWANPAFWLSLSTGCAACLLTIGLAPLASAFFRTDQPEKLSALIVVLAFIFPIAAAGAVSRARLQIDMRFRELAVIGVLQLVLDVSLKITLAWLGFGAFSFVYAMLAMSVFYLIACWFAAPPPVRRRPQLRRWKYLLSDGWMVVAAAILYWVIDHGDYLVLGRFTSVEIVGVYFFAYKISRHTMSLLTHQFGQVLLPALSSLPDDPTKQARAFMLAARLMMVASMPFCIGLALVSHPLIRLLFEPRWYDASLLISIMSIGMALRTVSWPAASLLQAQGRFATRMALAVLTCVLFFPATIVGTWLGQAVGLAIAVAGVLSVMALVDVAVALRPAGKSWSGIVEIFRTPILANGLAASISAVFGYYVLPRLPLQEHPLQVAQIVGMLTLAALLYVVILRSCAPTLWQEGIARFRMLGVSPLRRTTLGRHASSGGVSPPTSVDTSKS